MAEHNDHKGDFDHRKAELDRETKKARASGNDRWLTDISRRRADLDELEAEQKEEEKKNREIDDRISATGDIEAIKARVKELQVRRTEHFKIPWKRIFPSRKPRNS